jgi:hypothetical protein
MTWRGYFLRKYKVQINGLCITYIIEARGRIYIYFVRLSLKTFFDDRMSIA